MRLLHFESNGLALTNFTGKPIPAYAILSHRWTAEEVLFDDVKRSNFKEDSAGWRKIKFCAEKAAADGLKYFWCDTCCINRWDTAELARSVNSMFKYYRQAAKCYVYLQDTPATTNGPAAPRSTASIEDRFRKNEWFKRGWTLQELVAPSSVEFFDEQGHRLGDRTSHRQAIHEITGIPLDALDGDLDKFSRENRLKWAEGRVTTEPEDGAYRLLGILGVQMPLTYGEGRDKAFARLYRELEADTKAPCLIPFSRKDYTIGNASILHELEKKFFGTPKARFMTIVGEGGLGKSHLALEFAYTARESRPDCSVFWCDASNADSLHQSYSDVAQKLQIASDQEQPDYVRSKLHQYLGSGEAGEWLLIYDNVVDASTMSTTLGIRTSRSLAQSLPDSPTGSILLTTRNSEVSHAVSSEFVRVAAPNAADSAAMLQSYLADLAQAGDQSMAIAQLTRILRRPLAIVITAACIRTEGIAVDEYIAQFESWAREVRADSTTASASVNIASAEQSTTDVIRFTLSRIMKADPAAFQCILEMACLHDTDIPLSFVYASAEDKTHPILATLESYAIITRRPALSAVDMHSLVHVVVRQELDKLESRSQCVLRVSSRLLGTFPEMDETSRSQWRRLVPHGRELFSVANEGPHARELFTAAYEGERHALFNLKHKCSMALYWDGRYCEAEELQTEALEPARLSKMSDANISAYRAILAATVEKLGRLEEAEQLQAQSLDTSEKDPGDENQLTRLTNLNNLATTYIRQSRWKEAEALQRKVMEESKAALGPDHHLTLCVTGNLATSLADQGRWQEAADLQLQVYETMTDTIGPEHSNTLGVRGSLGEMYRSQGRLKESEEVLTQVLATQKVVLGPAHPNTLITMGYLAMTFGDQGRYKDAEELERHVLETNRRVRGDAHTETMASANNLSKFYMDQGRLREAADILSKLLDTAKTALRVDHPSVLTYRGNLACAYISQGRLPEGEELVRENLRVAKAVLGPGHPDMLADMNTLASAVGRQGRLVEAREVREEALGLCTTILGPRNPYTLTIQWNLALAYERLRRWVHAETLLLDVLRSRMAVLGYGHPETLAVRGALLDLLRGYIVRFDPSKDWNMFRFALLVRALPLRREMGSIGAC